MALAGSIYGAWFALIALSPLIGAWPAALLLVPVLTLHSSLQHELLHGHPFRSQRLNDLLAMPGLGILLPYGRFAALHRAHHATPALADPACDPESHYILPAEWGRLGPVRRALRQANRCLAGRMLLGPPLFLAALAAADLRAIAAGDRTILRDWLVHLATAAAVVWIVSTIGGMPLWLYLAACWAALSVLAIRTFLEHRAGGPMPHRSVIIERGGLLGFLFLNNHLHAVHHARPAVAWYRLPALYRRRRAQFLRGNGGYAFPSYGAVIRRYLVAAKEPAVYPAASLHDPAPPTP